MKALDMPSCNAESEEAVRLLQEAVRINTVSKVGDEHSLARLLAARLEQDGISYEIHALDDQRANLIARLRSGRPGPCVVLSGHMDTVPVGSVPWRLGALDAVIEDGNMYGRGTVDMKSGLLALTYAFLRFARRPADSWSGELILAATSTEETGSEGAKAMVEQQLLPAFDAMIIGEPTDCRLVVAHKGALWTRVCSCGKASHSSMPDRGINAIDKLFPFYQRLSEVDMESRPHELLSPSTLSVTLINGGKQANVIPDRCELTIDMRTLPDQSHAGLTGQMKALGERIMAEDDTTALEFETLLDVPAVSTDPQASIVSIANKVLIEQGLDQTEAKPRGAQYFTDASVLQALGKNIIVLGPGKPGLAHQVNEHVSIADYIASIDIYEKILDDYMK
ncbi:M20 family metallopeptidase [Pusillimonas sp. MFBS29]|uniref:M20 family metallopeptidase n=1 Tax=Pusillimonas sp. MFBS29 TaxID=2886690 RepID=UPI001D0FEC59|nr:M20 family metallopeptidase [Pusillimonas sp. MFBS29]MCC2596752.1 M20 family metallopeptidase [Pusillimonas sp. MFBS29]